MRGAEVQCSKGSALREVCMDGCEDTAQGEVHEGFLEEVARSLG